MSFPSYTEPMRRSRRRSWVLAAAILALALGSCASPTPDAGPGPGPAAPEASPSPPAAPSPQPTSEAPAGGPEVPRELRFSAPALGGGTIDGADYAGSDLVIWFWAPW